MLTYIDHAKTFLKGKGAKFAIHGASLSLAGVPLVGDAFRGSRSGRRFAGTLLVFALAMGASQVAQANAIYTNFGPGQSYSNGGFPLGKPDEFAAAFSFIPSANAIVGSVSVALSCITSCPDNFTVQLTDSPGSGASGLLESWTLLGSVLSPNSSSPAPLVLPSAVNPSLMVDTEYWITVSTTNNDEIEWASNSTSATSDYEYSFDNGGIYSATISNYPNAAFEVDAEAATGPEPSTFLLSGGLLAGGVLLAAWRRRRLLR